ncbi:ABC transporter permease [candidate division KSB1 bacterium]|nr:ABC transporter permease [candidate division KSB1 bacterium]
MKVWAVFRKTLLEQKRDLASLLMVLLFCPFFVYLYWLMSGGGSMSYHVIIINEDAGFRQVNEGENVIAALESLKYESDAPIVKVRRMQDRTKADERLKNRYDAAMLIIPPDFSRAMYDSREHAGGFDNRVTIVGDPGNPTYTVASILALTAVDQVVQEKMCYKPPVGWQEEFINSNKPRSEFETYVPGLLVLAIMMLLFTTALPLVREREAKTLRRLQLSSTTSFDLLTGISLAQIIIGAVTIVLTFYTAIALGFRSEGPLWIAMVIGVLTTFSVVAVGLLTACFCKNATAVLTIGTFPFFLLMWFTGAGFPVPRLILFAYGARQFALNDILPPTHAVIAMNKVLSMGATFIDVWPEMALMMALTVIYYALGVTIFKRTQMRRL